MAELIPPRRNEFLTRDGVPTTRFAEYLEELARSINTSDAGIELLATVNAANAAISSLQSQISALYSVLDVSNQLDLEGLYNFSVKPEYISTSINHTTSGNEVIEATAELTITLNTNPKPLEMVSVKRNGVGVVTIAGTIDGEANFKLLYNLESVDLLYNGTSWIIT